MEGRECGDVQGDPLPVLLVLGVASGFSVWVIPVSPIGREYGCERVKVLFFQPGGDAREVYCCYGDGETARTVCLLPTPKERRGGGGGEGGGGKGEGGEGSGGRVGDQFASRRPIMAVVKKGRWARNLHKSFYCCFTVHYVHALCSMYMYCTFNAAGISDKLLS